MKKLKYLLPALQRSFGRTPEKARSLFKAERFPRGLDGSRGGNSGANLVLRSRF
jgi:hypothetical protein